MEISAGNPSCVTHFHSVSTHSRQQSSTSLLVNSTAMLLALQVLSLSLMLSSSASQENSPCADLCEKCHPVYQYNIEDASTVFSGCSAVDSANANVNVTSSSETFFLKILDIKAAQTVDVKGRNHSGRSEYYDYNWRIGSASKIVINSGSFVDARVNIYILNVTGKLTINSDAFVNCRGSLFLLDVNRTDIDKKAFSSDSDVTVILRTPGSSKLNRLPYSSALVFRPLQQPFSTSNDIALATLATGYAAFALCAVVAILLLVILLTMKKLFRQNFESVKLKPLKSQTNNVNGNRQNAPLPHPPRNVKI